MKPRGSCVVRLERKFNSNTNERKVLLGVSLRKIPSGSGVSTEKFSKTPFSLLLFFVWRELGATPPRTSLTNFLKIRFRQSTHELKHCPIPRKIIKEEN